MGKHELMCKYNLRKDQIPFENVYHVNEWRLYYEWKEEICKTNNIELITNFYNKYIKNLIGYSNFTLKDIFFGNVTINYDFGHRFINDSFRDLAGHDCISKDVIKWFVDLNIIDDKTYHFLFNTLCIKGRLETAKYIYSLHKIDFHKRFENIDDDKDPVWCGYIDYFRNAVTHNHYEMAKWLRDQDAIPKEQKLIDNIRELSKTHCNLEMQEWLESLDEFKQEIVIYI